MSIICPNMKNPDVAREFNELKEATSEKAAYAIWSRNNGNAIDKAPNGALSKLFQNLLNYFEGDRNAAIRAKANIYSNEFIKWFGDWIGANAVYDSEPAVISLPIHNMKTDIKNFKHSLYRGQGYAPNIDENGNLVLHTNWDSLGKTHTLSFDYTKAGAEHYGHRAARNPYIIEIDEDYLDSILPKEEYDREKVDSRKRFRYDEESNEVRLSFDNNIVIPKSKFNIYQNLQTILISSVESIIGVFLKINSLIELSEIEENNGNSELSGRISSSDIKGLSKTIDEFLGEYRGFRLSHILSDYVSATDYIPGSPVHPSREFEEFQKLGFIIHERNYFDPQKINLLPINERPLISGDIAQDETGTYYSSYLLSQDIIDHIQAIINKNIPNRRVNEVSKAVDENGEPLILWHGTDYVFDEFKYDENNERGSHKVHDVHAFFFTDSQEKAFKYRYNITMPVFLNMKNPGESSVKDGKYRTLNEYTNRENELIRDDQYDSVFIERYDKEGDHFGMVPTKQWVVKKPNQIKSAVSNTGVFSENTENIYDDYETISELNNYDSFIDAWIIEEIIRAQKENPSANILEIAQNAKRKWISNKLREILNDTQMRLAEAYGLRQEVDEDGRIRFVSDSNDEETNLIIDFLDYISGEVEGYYDHNSKSTAAHHTIAISLANGDPSTFSHELAHHYIRMFWKSKLILTALRAVDKPGMTDEEREEALVDIITAKTNDSDFFSSIESESFVQKFWGAFANMLYRTFGIENKAVRNALYRNITKAFVLNEKQNTLERLNRIFAMADQRMFKKHKTYKEKVKAAREQAHRNKSNIAYEQVGNDKTLKAIKSIVQGSISRNKNFRKSNIENPKILVDMLIAEDRVRKFVEDINEYRKNFLSSIGVTKKPTTKLRKDSVYTTEELNANVELIRGFVELARNELYDISGKFRSMSENRWAAYVSKEIVDPVTGEVTVEYLYPSHISDPDVQVTQIEFKELNDIKQNVLGFYDKTIKDLYAAVRSVEFKNLYGADVQLELLLELTSVNTTATGGIRLLDLISDLNGCYDDAITEQLHLFITRFVNENAKNLTDEQKEKLIYSTNTWLENQNAFGDIGVTEVWLGLASNSKSSLIRIMLDMIDTMSQEQNDVVNKKGFELRRLRIEAMRSLTLKGYGAYGAISPYNIDKILMESDDDGFSGNFITAVNEGKFYRDRSNFIDELLYGKTGLLSKLRSRLGDKTYELEIDALGEPIFPEGQDDIEKEYLHAINHWLEKHAVRRYTAAYYDKRIDMLSSVTRKAQTRIQNQINEIIKACTIDGKVHTELLTRTKIMDLQRLYYRKSLLSNPFDEYGREKVDGTEEALIAKELTAWNKWQGEHIKNKLDYDAFEEAKKNAKDPDQFERDNTYTAINPEVWDEIARLFPKSASSTLEDLRYTRSKLISIIKTKRGLYSPRFDQVLDMETGEIRPGYEEFWANLKHYDELINTLKKTSSGSKWTKALKAMYKQLMTSVPIMLNLPGGTSQRVDTYISTRIKKRLEAKYGKNDPRVAKELAAEMEKFQYTVRTPGGSAVEKGPLSVFFITMPPAVKVSTSKGLIDSTVKEPILAYSVIDADASDPMYVDRRFDETSGKTVLPITDDTKLNSDDVSYTNEKYQKYIVNGPKALLDYYNALRETMRESYENIPFAGKYDDKLPQQGATTGQMFHRNKWWNIAKPLFYWAKRRFGINESDTDINIDYELRPDGRRSMNIPVRYIKRLDNPNEINSDLLGSVMDFYEMSQNYKNKSKALPLFLTAVEKLESNVNNRDRQKTFLKGIINRSFYERSRNFDTSEDNLKSYVNKWVRRALKWVPGLRALTTTGLLALNWLAGIVAYLDPAVLIAMDAAAGRYMGLDDYIIGTTKMLVRLPAALASAGKSVSYDKISSGMVKFGLAKTGAANFRHMDRSQVRRFLQDGLLMIPFSLGEHTVNALVFSITMNNYRYVEDAQTFMNKQEYFEYAQSKGIPMRTAKLKFSAMPTMFNAYYTNKNGEFVPTNNKYGKAITPELELRIGKRMRNRATVSNLIVPNNERTKIQSNIITAFVVVMRTFMLVGISERFRSLRDFQIEDDSPIDETKQSDIRSYLKKEYYDQKGGYNFQTGEIEDGVMSAFFHIFANLSGNLQYMLYSLKHPFRSRYNEKTQDFIKEKRIAQTDIYAFDRIASEIAAIALLALILTAFHNRMVDSGNDDKYWYQVIDHILIRLAIVRYTWFDFNTFLDLINSITPSKSDIDKKLKFADLVIDSYKGFQEHGTNYEDWEKVKSVGYKNAPKAFIDLLLTFSSLGLHNLYTSKNTEGIKIKTKWFKKMVWWRGYWHDAPSGRRPSKDTKKSNKDLFDNFDNLDKLNNFDNFDNFDKIGRF